MQSNYKKIGEHIQLVDERNKGLQVKQLLGLSISKQFIPSVANTVGTDMRNYKIIRKNQFACSTMQVRRDKKIPIALLQEYDEAIISQAYPVFEVKDENLLMPEYLMMWFSREEFDREACFHAVGGVRGSLEWEDFCNMRFPLPSPEKQREIVAEYNIVKNRITINNQLIQKLEETAQAIYKQWFVDFEFPIDNNFSPSGEMSAGQRGYKSNGGEMVYNKELEKEIPKEWEAMSITKLFRLSGGGTPDTQNVEFWNGQYPFFTPADVNGRYYCIITDKSVTRLGIEKSSTQLYPANTVFVTARGTVGAIVISGCDMTMNQSCYALSGKNPYFVHQTALKIISKLKNEAIGAVFNALVAKDFDEQFLPYPLNMPDLEGLYQHKVSGLYAAILNELKENNKLEELKSLLLSKLATIEN